MINEKDDLKDNLKESFECAYLFLLIDQYEDGLWGKSIQAERKRLYSSSEEAQIIEKRKRGESITVTFFAVDAIYSFTKNPKNPAIELAFASLPNHKDDDGGYGSFGELISAYPIPEYKVMTSCRHTATALLMYLLFQDIIDEKISRSIKFLIDHVNRDGGWGVTADQEKEDSDCLTTSYVLELLTIVRKMGVTNILSEDYSYKLEYAIMSGLKWLKRTNQRNNGFWVFSDEGMKLQYTAMILTIFRELKNLEKGLYKRIIHKIVSLQRDDGGWPLSTEGRSELSSTVWVINALINSNRNKYTRQIEEGIDFIMCNISEWSYTRNFTVADWAFLLKLADYKNIHISHNLDDEIQDLANEINTRAFQDGDIDFVRKRLPAKFHALKEPILGVFGNYRPNIMHRNIIERWLDRTSPWQKWLIPIIVSVILFLIGMIIQLLIR